MSVATRIRTRRPSRPASLDAPDTAPEIDAPIVPPDPARPDPDVLLAKLAELQAKINAPAPTDSVAVPIVPPPADPAPSGPDLKAALGAPIPPADPTPGRSGDPAVIAVDVQCERLADLIRKQSGDLVAFYIARGRIVADIIDAGLSRARNNETRKAQRAAALRAAELTALGAYDASAENKPDPDRWHRIAKLTAIFPAVANMAYVSAAERLTALISRVDPPTRWDEPESWTLKPQYNRDAVSAMIDRAVAEKWARDEAVVALDALNGAKPVPPAAPKKGDDAVKAARALASRIMIGINDRKIDPETLFDELQAQLTRYGWTLVKGRTGNGAETLKPVKSGRAETIPISAAV